MEMYIFNGIRYRYEDAKRLGLIPTDGKVVTARSKPATDPRATDPAAATTNAIATGTEHVTGSAETTPQVVDGEEPPAASATKKEWVEYALEHGKTGEDIDGLTAKEIAALFGVEKN